MMSAVMIAISSSYYPPTLIIGLEKSLSNNEEPGKDSNRVKIGV